MKNKEKKKDQPFFVHTMVEIENGRYVTSDYADACEAYANKD